MLVGRATEQAAIQALLDDARAGAGGVLILRGEPGVGKTALLREATERASGMEVLRAVGVEAEWDVAFAALHQALRPLRHLVARLPGERAVLLGDMRLADEPERVDRFAVAIAALDLLALAAEATPLLVAIDDAQWIDDPSAEAFSFVARRLVAEPIAMLVATRAPSPTERAAKQGLPDCVVAGLPHDEALVFLATLPRTIAPSVAEKLVLATGGNPLALEEALRTLDDRQLSGEVELSSSALLSEGVEESYRRRLDTAARDVRRALLVTAASESDDLTIVEAALASLHLGAEALRDGLATDLLQIRDGSIVFRHPLARSAVHRSASTDERREVHRALANALAGPEHADLRVWHLAASAAGPDDEIADELERTARVALRRGGLVVAASALRRAAELTPDTRLRVERLTDAADVARQSGRVDDAIELSNAALALTEDPGERADLHVIQGFAEFSRDNAASVDSFVTAADLLVPTEPGRAAFVLGQAIACAGSSTGDFRRARRLAARAEELHDPSSLVSLTGLVVALAWCGRSGDCDALLRTTSLTDLVRACAGDAALLTSLAYAPLCTGRADAAHEILDRVVADARAEGALGILPYALNLVSELAYLEGDWLGARIADEEAAALGDELGLVIDTIWARADLCLLAGAQGRADDCRRLADETLAETTRIAPEARTHAHAGVGLLLLGTGDAAGASTEFGIVQRLVEEYGNGHVALWTRWLPNLVEAYARAGRGDEARRLIEGASGWSPADTLAWGLAGEARCRGLLADADSFEGHFERALELEADIGHPFEQARTKLCYGERLRRARRRADARVQLRDALHVFERLQAEPWAARARDELRATGETVTATSPSRLGELTPHELRVASVVATGARNKEIAAKLFVTPKTVDYHLRSIYRKLGIHSRSELMSLYLAQHGATGAGVST
jgi:DNA-binding CsgD family transcriptional regulator